MSGFKCGFIGIVGPTNSGKSTLMNAILGRKVSITSPLPQTTYHGIRGVLNRENAQMIFTDTPGFQRHRETIPRLLNKVADRHAEESDCLLWVFDASGNALEAQVEELGKKISALKKPELTLCALNKVDIIAKPKLLPVLARLSELGIFSEIVPISAKRSNGIDRLLNVLEQRIPEGHAFFEANDVTDRPKEFLASEFIREKVYHYTRQEVPYAVRVELEPARAVESSKVPHVFARIHVDSESKKGILIGKAGEKLKRIGMAARKDIEDLLGEHICLNIQVRVDENWKKDSRLLHRYLELT